MGWSALSSGGNFTLRLTYLKRSTDPYAVLSTNNAIFEFNVLLTEQGKPYPHVCARPDRRQTFVSEIGFLNCEIGGTQYEFNMNSGRFTRVDTAGYVVAWDKAKYAPSVAGRVCTRTE
jgi:hypothetical protein